jgi:hypothetical protein
MKKSGIMPAGPTIIITAMIPIIQNGPGRKSWICLTPRIPNTSMCGIFRGEQYWGYNYWESLETGSYYERQWEYGITSEDLGGGSWSYTMKPMRESIHPTARTIPRPILVIFMRIMQR